MDADFWHERWEQGQTAFDQQVPHRWLDEHWSELNLSQGSTVFVPLCGKSVDMVWLADHGHRVLGVELSPIAISEFFAGVGLEPEVRTEGAFTVSSAGAYELWCGDLFAFTADTLAGVAAVYDRASMVALPPEMRVRFADHLTAVVPQAAPIFLVTFAYDQSEMSGPPHSVTQAEVAERFVPAFVLTPVEDVSVIENAAPMRERGLTELHEALVLLRR
jgi:thiopurine S-methyltransferase